MSAAAALVVLQARTGSTRLPGKVLADLAGLTVLERSVRRLVSAEVGPVVVATTTLAEDDRIVCLATSLGVEVVRGPVEDVLGRFLQAAESWGEAGRAPAFVIRATADNPLVDPAACIRVLEPLQQGADYVSEKGLPVGAAVEGMTLEALRTAGRLAGEPYDREHVTPWLRRAHDRIQVRDIDAPPAVRRPALRFTLDTAADLAYLMALLDHAGRGADVPLADYIAAADRLATSGAPPQATAGGAA